ncbi:homocysteine S-methyltransferase-like isoform X1 [Homalodisca vitripennis]|uniref:homocysteine S-methyltransferase-like isoform X1 n=1 Tax=Homalodisca vitripennis TaxID=197043 RepID=UPI001EE9F9D8|nr:homocysteine S-methyltransferase-like isoform X1 [Homalodisca vitripennis]
MVVLLDGSFATQIKKYVDEKEMTNSPLWSSQYLSTDPNAVLNTHCDYINAGCQVISTNTYQASVEGFQKHLGVDVESGLALIRQAVTLAKQAVVKCASSTNPPRQQVMIAGSVGPYGACLHDGSEYRGEYIEDVTAQQLRDWHRPRITALVAAGVDLLAVETIPAVQEAVIVLNLLREEFSDVKAWVSFTCKDKVHTSHGEPFHEAVLQCCQTNRSQLVAVGVNCVAPAQVSSLLTSVQGLQVPFIVYPNSGETWTPGVGWTNKEACLPLVHYLPEWVSLGAQYIGGCCQTDAEDIRQCREFIDKHDIRSSTSGL